VAQENAWYSVAYEEYKTTVKARLVAAISAIRSSLSVFTRTMAKIEISSASPEGVIS